jgi:hypothetical protein
LTIHIRYVATVAVTLLVCCLNAATATGFFVCATAVATVAAAVAAVVAAVLFTPAAAVAVAFALLPHKPVVKSLVVCNAGWQLESLPTQGCPMDHAEQWPEELRIRGYRMRKKEQRVLAFPHPGTYVIDEAGAK